MQQQFNCPSCKKPYQQSNLPRLLIMCGHSFCQKCIKTFILPNKNIKNKFKVVCPEDQQFLEISHNRPSLFPKNLALFSCANVNKKRRSKTMITSTYGKFKSVTQQNPIISHHNISNMSISRIKQSEEPIHSDADLQGNQFLYMISSDKCLSSNNKYKYFEQHRILQQVEIQEEKLEENNICLLHQKELEIVCIQHRQRICVNCALFGSHKGHTFKNVHQIEKQSQKVREELYRLISVKKQLENKKNNHDLIKTTTDKLKTKINKMKTQTNIFFERLIENIKQYQKQKIQQIEKLKTSIDNKIKDSNKLKTKPYHQNWQKKAEQLIKKFEEQSIQQRVSVLYSEKYDQLASNLIQEGILIGKQLMQKPINQFNEINRLIQICVVDKNEEIQSKIRSSLKILTTQKKNIVDEVLLHASQPQKKVFYPNNNIQEYSESLLEFDQPQQGQQSLLQQSFNNQNAKKKINKQNSLLHFKRYEKVGVCDPLQTTISQGTKSCFGNPQSLKKKKTTSFYPTFTPKNLGQTSSIRKMSVFKASSTKYQKVLEGLKANTLEVIDLTGAQLGKQIIQELGAKYLKNSKVKTLKLIRNHLTDEALQNLIPNLQSISVLNLSQNQLTQKSINLLLENIQNLPNLKSIVLSQNKIIERKLKPQIQKLKLHGIVITI